MTPPATAGDATPPATERAATPPSAPPRKRRWDVEPDEAPAEDLPKRRRSRWDETPAEEAAPRSRWDATPAAGPSAPRSRYMSDAELDALLPSTGYRIVDPPPDYAPIRTGAHKLMDVPEGEAGFSMPESSGLGAMAGEIAADLPTDVPVSYTHLTLPTIYSV